MLISEQQGAQSSHSLTGRSIIVVALSDWDGPRRIRHYLTDELVEQGNRVLYVEAGFTLTRFLRTWGWRRFYRFRSGVRQEKPNLYVISAPPFLPGGEFSSVISSLNWHMTLPILTRLVHNLDFKNPILWIYAYNASLLVGKMGEDLSVYLCNDAFPLLFGPRYLRRLVRSVEQKLLRKVDITISLSEKLTQDHRPFTRRAETIHHGVDIRMFDRVLAAPSEVPLDITGLPRPIIGYCGVIRFVLDLDLIRTIATSHPEWSVVLVGPILESSSSFHAKVNRLRRVPNIHLLGVKSAEEVPKYLSAFDVAILPYAQSELLPYYTVPLKFYEYLAAGKPVVWSIGPRELPQHILINAQNSGDFVAAISRALTFTDPRYVDSRKSMARQNSWAHRVAQIASMLHSVWEDRAKSSDFP